MESNTFNIKSLVAFLSILVAVSFIGVYRSCTVQKEGNYTIATVYKLEGARGGSKIHIEYYVKGKRYTGSYISDQEIDKKVGRRFFLQYLPSQPNRCHIEGVLVPDSITEAPPEGWQELPIIATP